MIRLNPLEAGASSEAIRDIRRAKHTLYLTARQAGWVSTSDHFGIVVTPDGLIRLCAYSSDVPAEATAVVLTGGPLPLSDYPALARFTNNQEVWL